MLVVLLHIILFFQSTNLKVPDFIKEYDALSNKAEELKYIDKYQDSNNINIKAYVVSLKMKQAEYKLLPWSKLKIFNSEKRNIENLINKNPNNIHLRYIRLVIQENLPRILNYHSHIKEDQKFLKEMLSKKDKTDYLDKYIIKNTSL
ncbi:hypothetical protein H3Z83_12035 [Tenacibaculum sp. S7007]|uniref:Uncharacterized protein n=1 Tax=Tenacibaculum pelagium TaxID=2759527 RepID=A0A839AQ76_9FLAO|nr:hypothetical protein [Tenacibaculum pelagium]MBA6157243.1 hypothetical protein [Tenacibaculum pelagium]